jgi:predicted PurR-regulated permease PerM
MDEPVPAALARKADVTTAGKSASGLTIIATCAGVIAALSFGREVLVPFALAILLSFVLAPGVRWLRRWYVGRIASVIMMVAVAFFVIFSLGAVIATQVATLGENLPQYEWTIRGKIRLLQEAFAGSALVERASRMLRNLSEDIARPETTAEPITPPGAEELPKQEPLPVQIQEPQPPPLQVIQSIIEPLVQPTATTGIIIVFVIFILLQREDLRDRLIRLAGTRDLQRTTQAITDAAERVSRYLLMQTILNAIFGLAVGTGLWLIGVPNPVLWGIMAMVLRYVPFIGPIVAAVFPAVLSVAVDPGWTMLVWTAALFVVVEVLVQNLLEPWLYGGSTGLSAVAIIAAATFWTWLWGPIGLLLSTPLTACVVVLGRHVPQLQFLDVALGSEPVLTPEEGFYQRMLAGDPSEAAGQAEEFMKEKPLSAYYDEVLIPALALAQYDMVRGKLDGAQRAQIRATVEEVVDDLSDHEDAIPQQRKSMAAAVVPNSRLPEPMQSETASDCIAVAPHFNPAELPADWQGKPVLCIAGRTELDQAAGSALAQLLDKHGIGALVLPWEATSASNLKLIDAPGAQLLCVSSLDPGLMTHVRFLIKRLRRKFPSATIMAGFWTLGDSDKTALSDRIEGTGANFVVRSLREAVETICQAAQEAQQRNHIS